jgi:hypothetical protein
MQSTLQCTNADRKSDGRFGRRQTLDVAQQDHFTVSGIELCNRMGVGALAGRSEFDD